MTIKIIVFALLPIITVGQKKYSYKIDTAKILTNKNLNNFIISLKNDTFQNFTNKNAIPTYLKKQLNYLTDGFSIANPDQDYRCCCISPRRLPYRKLIGSPKYVMLSYTKQ